MHRLRVGQYEISPRRAAAVATAAAVLAGAAACSSASGSTSPNTRGSSTPAATAPVTATPTARASRAPVETVSATPSEGSPSSITPGGVYREALRLHATIVEDCGALATSKVAERFYPPGFDPSFKYFAFGVSTSNGGPQAKCAIGPGNADVYFDNNAAQKAEATEDAGVVVITAENVPNSSALTYAITPQGAQALPSGREVSSVQAAALVDSGTTMVQSLVAGAMPPAGLPAALLTPPA
jgi:hypothetical protein